MPKVLFLGTAGYHPSETRHTACAFLPNEGIVLDAGTGLFRLAGRTKTEFLDIFISHAHLDHIVGLTYLLDIVLRYPAIKSVRVYAAKEHIEAIKEHLYAESIFPVAPEWEFIPVGEGLEIRGIKVKTSALNHRGGATGYRFEFQDGKVLAYITDTIADERYLSLMREADLAIHENNFPDAQKDIAERAYHSYTSAVAELAQKARVRKLALFHFDPFGDSKDPARLNEAEKRFENTIIAEDFMEIDF